MEVAIHLFRIALLILLGSLASGSRVHAAVGDTSFSQGNALYAAGNYAGAVDAYEGQVRRGNYTANLFYNLADSYYRQGSRGRAILNYQRALLLDPAHAEATSNLAFVRGVKSRPPAPHIRWMATVLPWTAAAAVWLGLTGLIVAVWSRRHVGGWLLAGAGGVLCAASVAALWFAGPPSDAERAVVVAESAPVFYAPADNSKVVTTLTAGGEVRVLSDQGAWVYTLLSDGTLAWIASDKIERLVPR